MRVPTRFAERLASIADLLANHIENAILESFIFILSIIMLMMAKVNLRFHDVVVFLKNKGTLFEAT